MTTHRIFIALTGASGSIYGLRLMEELCRRGFRLLVTVSASGQLVCQEETGLDLSGDPTVVTKRLCERLGVETGIEVVSPDNLFVSAASGSAAPEAMILTSKVSLPSPTLITVSPSGLALAPTILLSDTPI